MKIKHTGHMTCLITFAVLWLIVIALFAPSLALADEGIISSTDKYAWAENAGWLNFRPVHAGVVVYLDHLEGYAWAEKVGWIKLGSHSGGGAYTYSNTSNTNWGVNHDGYGKLSGYAWSETVGWINFNLPQSPVMIDLATGEFEGFTWSENVGWIHFKNSIPAAYKVATAGADDVTITKDVSTPFVAPGEMFSYTITATNLFDEMVDLMISDALSALVEYVAGTLEIFEAGTKFEGTIDASDKYAWTETAGWINFRPTNSRVRVYANHLEGSAWAEKLGWIKLGGDDGGGTPYYQNDSKTNWGVNHNGIGNLSGYAWSETVGWINFNPDNSQVTLDLETGTFNGYAWAENVGWIHFKEKLVNPIYMVKATIEEFFTDGLLEYTSGLLNPGETLMIAFDVIVSDVAPFGELITNIAEVTYIGGLFIEKPSNPAMVQVQDSSSIVIPEPTTILLLGVGLAVLAALRRKLMP